MAEITRIENKGHDNPDGILSQIFSVFPDAVVWVRADSPYRLFVKLPDRLSDSFIRALEISRVIGTEICIMDTLCDATSYEYSTSDYIMVIPPRPAKPLLEKVNHPSHYGGGDNVYETIKVAEAKLTPEEFIGAMKFQVMKYNDRAKYKDSEQENYEKGKFYQDYLVEFMKRRKK